MRTERAIFLISGNQGAGKSTVARALAERRNKERPNKNVFHPWGPILDRAMRETTRDVGMWLDNSSLGVTETVDEILRRAWAEAVLS